MSSILGDMLEDVDDADDEVVEATGDPKLAEAVVVTAADEEVV